MRDPACGGSNPASALLRGPMPPAAPVTTAVPFFIVRKLANLGWAARLPARLMKNFTRGFV
jgi:hypothetical protein